MSNHTDAQLVEDLKTIRAHKTIAAAARYLGVRPDCFKRAEVGGGGPRPDG
jgi:hypothetical protein